MNNQLLEVVFGFNILVTRTHCALEPLELLSIILLLENITCSSFLEKISLVYADVILLNPNNIFYMTVEDSTTIGIWGGIQFLTSYFSLNSTTMSFPLEKTLWHHLTYSIIIFFFFYYFFSVSSYFISLFFFSFSLLYVVSVSLYVVTK